LEVQLLQDENVLHGVSEEVVLFVPDKVVFDLGVDGAAKNFLESYVVLLEGVARGCVLNLRSTSQRQATVL
jgi:hypothetical protein